MLFRLPQLFAWGVRHIKGLRACMVEGTAVSVEEPVSLKSALVQLLVFVAALLFFASLALLPYWEAGNRSPARVAAGNLSRQELGNASQRGVPVAVLPRDYTLLVHPPDPLSEPKNITLTYVLRGRRGSINYTVYGGLAKYLRNFDVSCLNECPNREDVLFRVGALGRDMLPGRQLEFALLDRLVEQIEAVAQGDDALRVAVSLVQNIPYDSDKLFGRTPDRHWRFPYEVLYDFKGVCGEKSLLLAYLLERMGYGVAIFIFEAEGHMAVGVKCPSPYDYMGTGYCFIESTRPTIITDSEGEYVAPNGSLIPLRSRPLVVVVSQGREFASVEEEYRDARIYEYLSGKQTLSEREYEEWRALRAKYGLGG